MNSIFSIIGAGGHAMVIADIIMCKGDVVRSFWDVHSFERNLMDIPVRDLSRLSTEKQERDKFVIAIGNNKVRKRVVDEFHSLNFDRAIHPNAYISKYAQIAVGTVIMSGTTVNARAVLGRHVILNTNASVDHECVIEDFVHISPNAALCGNVLVGEGSHIGAGAVVIPGIKIGKWCKIGAGTVIIKDIPDFATVVGNPGRIIKINKNE